MAPRVSLVYGASHRPVYWTAIPNAKWYSANGLWNGAAPVRARLATASQRPRNGLATMRPLNRSVALAHNTTGMDALRLSYRRTPIRRVAHTDIFYALARLCYIGFVTDLQSGARGVRRLPTRPDGV